eukprot:10854918-Lingulodinium_polyedra.AAC.1
MQDRVDHRLVGATLTWPPPDVALRPSVCQAQPCCNRAALRDPAVRDAVSADWEATPMFPWG